jgi:hypothetical protein
MTCADQLGVAPLRDQGLRRRRLTTHLTLRGRDARHRADAETDPYVSTRPHQRKFIPPLRFYLSTVRTTSSRLVTITTGPVRGPPLASEKRIKQPRLPNLFGRLLCPCVTERDYPVCEALVSSSASRDTFRAEVVRIEVVSSGAHRSAARGYESILDLGQRPRE